MRTSAGVAVFRAPSAPSWPFRSNTLDCSWEFCYYRRPCYPYSYYYSFSSSGEQQ
jgi:hypothetical protein